MDLDFIVINFLVYSVIGYCCEVIYCSVPARRIVNRGFLYGPWLPIYGFGAIIVILFLEPFREHWWMVFIFGLILTSALEYFTSWALEKIFHVKLWDYSKHRININGRVCALNSTLFGLMGLFGVYIADPFLAPLIMKIPEIARHYLSNLIIMLLAIDATASVIHMSAFRKRIEDLHEKIEAVKALEPGELRDMLEVEVEKAREKVSEKSRHILAAHPTISTRNEEIREELEIFRTYLENRKKIRAMYKKALKANRADFESKRD